MPMDRLWGSETETYQDGRCFPAQFEFHEGRDHFCLIDPEEMVFYPFLKRDRNFPGGKGGRAFHAEGEP